MARAKIEGCKCDRCGEATQFTDGEAARSGWGSIHAQHRDGTDVIGTREEAADLCHKCLAALGIWFEELRHKDAAE